ncbi:MAG: translation initiation factor IF-2 [Holosporales bacterium]|jgi:translation initiation factor IF-2|nr:translation initiation factor IF-2 [Holosporales bacterium]
MANTDDSGDAKQRKVLSIKIDLEAGSQRTPVGNKTVEVEIKRKRSGLSMTVETKARDRLKMVETKTNSDKLTEKEFKRRVKVLQEALKEGETAKADREVMSDPQLTVRAPGRIDEGGIDRHEKQRQDTERHPTQKPDTKRSERTGPSTARRDGSRPTQTVVFRASEYKENEISGQQQKSINGGTTSESPVFAWKQAPQGGTRTDDSRKKFEMVVKTRTSERRTSNSKKISRAYIDRAMNSDSEERGRSMASIRRARQKLRQSDKAPEVAKVIREVSIPDTITISELANRMAVRVADVIKYLMSIGTVATTEQLVDGDTAEVICTEFGHIPKRVSESDIENVLHDIISDPANMTTRTPIVAIMGHVDHGKTTLLDAIRQVNTVPKEAGGITQRVASYQIATRDGRKITFIDTPGHVAFSSMRARGTVITDIIVLVVAADDGVKDQTIEVIIQAKKQNVPIVVAINKVDKPNSNIERVKADLMKCGIVLEGDGGDVLSESISARQNLNIENLLDVILLQAEMMELSADSKRKAIGTVLESRIDKGRGVVATVIIQHGTIFEGDVFVAGSAYGKVRNMCSDRGERVKRAGPSFPVDIVGFNSSPAPGDVLTVVDSEQQAREIAEYRADLAKRKSITLSGASVDQLISGEKNAVQILNLLIKTDLYGSLEAVTAAIECISHPEVGARIIEQGVGVISESDVDFAKSSNATIVGFNVGISTIAKEAAKISGIQIIQHTVIYHMIDEIKSLMSKLLVPLIRENYIGTADVRKIFFISRLGNIAGCYVSDGIIKKNETKIKVIRDGKCLFEGKIKSMRHEKDEIKEARQNHECGILADGYNEFKEGDQIECYEIELKARSVD